MFVVTRNLRRVVSHPCQGLLFSSRDHPLRSKLVFVHHLRDMELYCKHLFGLLLAS